MQKVQLVKLGTIRARPARKNMPLQLTREAEAQLRTLAECLHLDNESTAVNELFYQFVLNQDADKRRMIMTVYQINAKNSAGIMPE